MNFKGIRQPVQYQYPHKLMGYSKNGNFLLQTGNLWNFVAVSKDFHLVVWFGVPWPQTISSKHIYASVLYILKLVHPLIFFVIKSYLFMVCLALRRFLILLALLVATNAATAAPTWSGNTTIYKAGTIQVSQALSLWLLLAAVRVGVKLSHWAVHTAMEFQS